MFDHVTLRTADLAHTARLLTAPLATLGAQTASEQFVEWDDFGYAQGEAVTRNVHIGLGAPDAQTINAFWRAGVDAGLTDDGAPGPRTQYGPGYVGGFLLDPDGNSIEACRHDNTRPPGLIDHVWLRVRDLEASKAFYAAVAEHTGFALSHEEDGLARFRGPSASLTLVGGTPVSEHLHIAFPGATDAGVEAFHTAAISAGAPDNGAPGERPEYHPGYYGAFVLDPDGHNIEVVNHHR